MGRPPSAGAADPIKPDPSGTAPPSPTLPSYSRAQPSLPPALVAEFTSVPAERGRGVVLDASPSTVPRGSTGVLFAWGLDNDGTIDVRTTEPVYTAEFAPKDTGERVVRLVVTAAGRSDAVTHPVRVPRDTVLVLLNGIEPLGTSETVDSYTRVTAPDAFGDLLVSLGCTGPWTGGAIARQCDTGIRARLYWSPFSYRGVDATGAPPA